MPINESPVHESSIGANAESYTILAAQPKDIPALQAAATATWLATYGEYLSASFIEDFLARAYSETELLAQIANAKSHFLVVRCHDELIGYGQVGPKMTRRDDAPVAPADLYRLYLLPAWQRKGIGSLLLAELEGCLRSQGYPLYGAYVHERNDPAKAFYARQGFVHKPECDIHDEWYMVKQLS